VSVFHIVWIKFNPEVPDERIAEHIAALNTLQDSVPGITGLSVGANFTDRAEGYTHGVIVELENKAALDVYATHPGHVAVAGPLKDDAHLLVMDYEA
jgi:hypothetical protein